MTNQVGDVYAKGDNAEPPGPAPPTEATTNSGAGVLQVGGRPGRDSIKMRHVVSKYGALAAMVLTFIAFSLAKPSSFLTIVTMKAILSDMSPALILALGATVVLATDQFDLSIGGLSGLLGAVVIFLISAQKLGLPLAVGLALVLVCGMGLGFLNGVLVAFAGASSFMATLAMGSVYQGLEDTLLQKGSVYQGIGSGFINITNANILGVSAQVYVAAAVALITYVLLGHTQIGRVMYAVGGNSEAARLSGVPVRWVRALAFTVVGLMSAIAGVLLASGAGAANPDAGIDYLLPAYAAAFLGSVMWKAGTFTAVGTILGALFLQIIGTGLSLFSVSASVVLLVQGGILVIAVLIARLGGQA